MKIKKIEFDLKVPKYRQIYYSLRDIIIEQNISNIKLPTIREMVSFYGVNVSTVVSAIRMLENNNYVTTKKGSGTYTLKNESYLEQLYKEHHIKNDMINFINSYPQKETFPYEDFSSCIDFVIKRDKGNAFMIENDFGHIGLRFHLSNYLEKYNQIYCEATSIMVISGSQQGIDLVSKAYLRPMDYVLTQDLTYNGAIESFRSRGAKITSVKSDNKGLNIEDLEKKIKLVKPKFLYLMTQYHNPTTFSHDMEQIEKIYDICKKYNLLVIEDDSMGELNFHREYVPPMKSIDKENIVILIKSFSKLLMPGLRIGFMVLPKNQIDKIRDVKKNTDISSSSLIQRALSEFFAQNMWDIHFIHLKKEYEIKFNFVLNRLENLKKYGIDFNNPKGGLGFFIKLPNGVNSEEFILKAFENGLIIQDAKAFRPNGNNEERFIKLSFSANDLELIDKGMHIFEKTLISFSNL